MKPAKIKQFKVFIQRLAIAAVFAFGFFLLFHQQTLAAEIKESRVLKGVVVKNIDLGNKTKTDAEKILREWFDAYQKNLFFEFNGVARPADQVLFFDDVATTEKALNIGRNKQGWRNFLTYLSSFFYRREIAPVWQFKQANLADGLKIAFADILKNPRSARFTIAFPEANTLQIDIVPEEKGFIFDNQQALKDLQERIEDFSLKPIFLKNFLIEPELKTSDLEPLKPTIALIFGQKEKTLAWQDKKWPISRELLSSWLEARRGASGQSEIILNEPLIQKFFDDLAAQVEGKPQKGVFELNNEKNRATFFSPPSPGEKILREENLALFNKILLDPQSTDSSPTELALLTQKTWPTEQNDLAIQYGIREFLGQGKTNFQGSPPNRVKNIKRGAELLNNLLIKPSEEFSLLANLRPFTEANGYFKELVIKAAERKTVPEVGGGLCQIGTTSFRVALNAGLPITMRQNHSYRVSYYEPPVGMDATIYDPWPDFKFINNTPDYLLLTTSVKGNYLTFELWGTSDNRRTEISTPVIYNVTSPPEKKIIETMELKPGQTKCTEKAHKGSDASFVYKIIYADGKIDIKEFKSHYIPWQEVCLLGVKELTPAPPTETPAPASPSLGGPVQPPEQTPENTTTPVSPD